MTNKIITLLIFCMALVITKAVLIILALATLVLLLWCLMTKPRATLAGLVLIPVISLANARPILCIVMIAVIIIVMIVARPKPQTREIKHLLIKDT